MKAIKDVTLEIEIWQESYKAYYWYLKNEEEIGFYGGNVSGKCVTTKYNAKRNWRIFARLNKVKNYEFVN